MTKVWHLTFLSCTLSTFLWKMKLSRREYMVCEGDGGRQVWSGRAWLWQNGNEEKNKTTIFSPLFAFPGYQYLRKANACAFPFFGLIHMKCNNGNKMKRDNIRLFAVNTMKKKKNGTKIIWTYTYKINSLPLLSAVDA